MLGSAAASVFVKWCIYKRDPSANNVNIETLLWVGIFGVCLGLSASTIAVRGWTREDSCCWRPSRHGHSNGLECRSSTQYHDLVGGRSREYLVHFDVPWQIHVTCWCSSSDPATQHAFWLAALWAFLVKYTGFEVKHVWCLYLLLSLSPSCWLLMFDPSVQIYNEHAVCIYNWCRQILVTCAHTFFPMKSVWVIAGKHMGWCGGCRIWRKGSAPFCHSKT